MAMPQYQRFEESLATLAELIAEEREWDDAQWRRRLSAACRSVGDCWAAFAGLVTSASALAELRDEVVKGLVQHADDLFYGRGESNAALLLFQLVIEIAPASVEGYKGCVVCHLQGSEIDPAAALPFAEKHVKLDPSRWRDVEYIRKLVAERAGEM
ncbi:MAG TPA: hypothetical protein VF384_02715 [Planctomycetota bacterium]